MYRNTPRLSHRDPGSHVNSRRTRSRTDGFALISVVLVLVLITALAGAFFALTQSEISSVRASADQASGFYSAEAGLNIRGEEVRSIFQGYARPSGESPDEDQDACTSGNTGAGDFRCRAFDFNNRTVRTFVVEDPGNNAENDSERSITIPPGERFAGLNAIQYRYSVFSEATPSFDDRPEAILEMVFRTRLVPLFQFAAFYNKDLEILPGPDMTLAGPVHVNGDLYVNANNTLEVLGEVSASESQDGTGGGMWRGRKDRSECGGTVRVNDADAGTNPNPAISCNGGASRLVPQNELDDWNGRIQTGMEPLTVPPIEEFGVGGRYWQEADLVVALDLRNGPQNAEVIVPSRPIGGTVLPQVTATDILNNQCFSTSPRIHEIEASHQSGGQPVNMAPLAAPPRAVEWSNSFRNFRENPGNQSARNAFTMMLEVDVQALMDCLHSHAGLWADSPSTENALDDTSSGGMVWYFTVLGPHSTATSSGYGVRLRNGAYLGSTLPGAPAIRGLTVISDQGVWIRGDYNLDGPGGALWRPASVLTDAIHFLSNSWDLGQERERNHGSRNASNTTIQTALLSGTVTTGCPTSNPGCLEGTGGQFQGANSYNGGLENYPRMHERWGGRTLYYRGSFVSLERPRRSTAEHGSTTFVYGAPNRDWGYDLRFNDVANLPPLSPRFVYLLQERFVRDYSR